MRFVLYIELQSSRKILFMENLQISFHLNCWYSETWENYNWLAICSWRLEWTGFALRTWDLTFGLTRLEAWMCLNWQPWSPLTMSAEPQFASQKIWGPNKASNLLPCFSFSIAPLALQLCISPYCQSELCSLTDEEFQPILICKFSIYVWLSPRSTSFPPHRFSPLFITKAGAHFLSPQSFQRYNTLFPCPIITLTSLAGLWKPDLPPFLYAGNYWQSTL